MRAKLLAVHWHNEQPVFSLDFQDSSVFATAGADKEVRVRQQTGS